MTSTLESSPVAASPGTPIDATALDRTRANTGW